VTVGIRHASAGSGKVGKRPVWTVDLEMLSVVSLFCFGLGGGGGWLCTSWPLMGLMKLWEPLLTVRSITRGSKT